MKKKPLKDIVYENIRDSILNQHYKPGQLLNERKISEALNVSRTPIREALKQLQAEDFVEYIPFKGVVVKVIGREDLRHIFQIRRALEMLVIEIAIDKINNETLRKLQYCIDTQSKQVLYAMEHLEEFMDLDLEFHDILAKISDNPLLMNLLWEMRSKTRILGINALNTGSHRFQETIEEHQAIVDALKADDMEAALEAIKRHIDATYRNAEEYLLGLES